MWEGARVRLFLDERDEPFDTGRQSVAKDWASNGNIHLVEHSRLDKVRNDVAFRYGVRFR